MIRYRDTGKDGCDKIMVMMMADAHFDASYIAQILPSGEVDMPKSHAMKTAVVHCLDNSWCRGTADIISAMSVPDEFVECDFWSNIIQGLSCKSKSSRLCVREQECPRMLESRDLLFLALFFFLNFLIAFAADSSYSVCSPKWVRAYRCVPVGDSQAEPTASPNGILGHLVGDGAKGCGMGPDSRSPCLVRRRLPAYATGPAIVAYIPDPTDKRWASSLYSYVYIEAEKGV